MSPDTAAMIAATMTAATFGAMMPDSSAATREGWSPRELQRSAATAGGFSLAGAALLSAWAGAPSPLYVSAALAAGLALVYQLAASANVR